jgi:hypothetical protein
MMLQSSLSSLIALPHHLFCMHEMHDTTYNTPIVNNLRSSLTEKNVVTAMEGGYMGGKSLEHPTIIAFRAST